MKKFTRVFAILISALMITSVAACQTEEKEASDVQAPSEVQSEASGNEPTAAPTPEPTAEPTPAPEEDDAVPTPAPAGDDGLHQSTLPAPESGSDAFIEEFKSNPIDAQYELDMNDAASSSALVDACNTAAMSWKEQIDAVYMQILDSADDEKAAEVKKTQEEWINNQNDSLKEIRNAVSEDDAMSSVSVAENIMLYYRSHAIDLCAVLYEIEGQLAFG